MSLTKQGFKVAVFSGIISWLFLAALLKPAELTTHLDVYTLLIERLKNRKQIILLMHYYLFRHWSRSFPYDSFLRTNS